MKNRFVSVVGLALLSVSGAMAAVQDLGTSTEVPLVLKATEATPWQAKQRAEHQTLWESTTTLTDTNTGQVFEQIHQYTELGSGLNFLDTDGTFKASKAEFAITQDGAECVTTQAKIKLPSDIGTAFGVEVTMPGGTKKKSHPLAVAYYDPVDGSHLILAVLTNSQGCLVAPNLAVYSNCFTGLKASICYKVSPSGIAQDLLLHESPPTPESYGLSSKSRLEIMTEFDANTPMPKVKEKSIDTETDANARNNMVEPDFVDQTLDFGQMKMGQGTAFAVGRPQDLSTRRSSIDAIPVGKKFDVIEGRKILIEAVEHSRVKPVLNTLPQSGQTSGIQKSSKTGQMAKSAHRVLPTKQYAGLKDAKFQVAQTTIDLSSVSNSPMLVLDYDSSISVTNDITFRADMTYYIASYARLNGSNVFEGGTVIKYNPDYDHSFILESGSQAFFKTSPYRPVIFTSKHDNTVGEAVSGSSGNPAMMDIGGYLQFNTGSPVEVNNVQVRYARIGIYMGDEGSKVRNAQFVKCMYSVVLDQTTLSMQNILIDGGTTGMYLSGDPCHVSVENMTVNNTFELVEAWTNTTVSVTNSILANLGAWGPDTQNDWGKPQFVTNSVWGPYSNSTFFAQAGAGRHYQTNGSPCIGAGTTNISTNLLAELKTRTVFAPTIYSNITITTNLTLGPIVARDTNGTTLGYHYTPLDYAFGGVTMNSNLTLNPGTACGWFECSVGGTGMGITLGNGGKFITEGTAEAPNIFARYCTVQEATPTIWANKGYMGGVILNGSSSSLAPEVRSKFTQWHLIAGGPNQLRNNTTYGQGQFVHSEFYAGNLYSTAPYYGFTNCLFDRIYSYYYETAIGMQNCTYRYGRMDLARGSSSTKYWAIRDGLMMNPEYHLSDGRSYNTNYTFMNFNGNTSGTNMLPCTGTNNYTNSTLVFESGPLGWYYQGNTSTPLYDKGSQNATNAGLYHFTVLRNQSKETNSVVDCGYHYVAVDANGVPIDTDGDGLADYSEDKNGDGVVTPSFLETDWQTYTTITNNFPQLQVFTPLR